MLMSKSRRPEAAWHCILMVKGKTQELKKLSAKHPNLVLIKLEMTDSASIGKAAKDVEKQLKGRGLNLLINNAGIITDSTLESVNEKDLLHVYMTNMVGPMLVTKAFLPLLKKAAQAVREAEMNWHKAVLINISSITSSIEKVPETYSFFPALSYRCSKAALNMLTRCQSVVYKEDGILCTAIHPGWVKTDLGGPQAPLTVDESVHGILKVLCALSEKHNGILVDWEGNTIPW
uniref:C-factor-like isoform X2 n=1 Tax=Geotrypetes seraphini TaxID=260995 RepID=A0A6P8QJA2_GEOSA|nr:C-factor-like isoform X2 [Geotrypetes seraphini]